ncbi:MAG: BMP family ABC transporter substrate-binding protein [Crenarchaeota archaeon]|nr:BMP family ABC transporter substrate-binding protein [Thermoproteota archaeon]
MNRSLLVAAAVVVVVAVVAGFLLLGGAPTATETQTQQPAATTAAGGAEAGKKVRVLVLFDVGGRGDLSFNDMAWLGAERAAKEFGVEVKFQTPRSQQDMVPLLERVSGSGEYDLIVLVGFLWTKPLDEVADKYPEQKYALIDATTGKERPNEVDILFREQEAAALIGILAADMAYNLMKEAGEQGPIKIGAVAGMDIPPLWKFHVGYLYGAKLYEQMTGRKVEFYWTYTGTFTDRQVGYQAAMQLLQQGVKVLYGLAGLTHLGMFDAVIEWNEKGLGRAFAIGQDASQEWYAPKYIPLSGAKRVDVAVYKAIEMVVKGEWEPGIHVLGLREGGVGIWDLEGVRWFAEQAYKQGRLKDMTPDQVVEIVRQLREKYISKEAWDMAKQLEEKIKNSEVKFKTPMSHDEYQKIIDELMNGNLDAALEK